MVSNKAAWMTSLVVALAGLGCGTSASSGFDGGLDGTTSRHDARSLGNDSGGGLIGTDSGGGLKGTDSGSSCPEGHGCGDAGLCAGGHCCPAALACAGTCCGASSVCSFGACVKPGASCFDSTGCDAGQYCQYSTTAPKPMDAGAGCVGGALPEGHCLPAPPTCTTDGGTDAATCIESCQYHPDAGAFAPVLKYTWGGIVAGTANDIMMAPVVLPMEDTNCDGKVNGDDIPDIVFTTFAGGNYESNGTLHAVAVRDGALVDRWSVPSPLMVGGTSFVINPAYQLAGADLDGKPGAEVVACLIGAGGAGGYGVAAFHPDGSLDWALNGPLCEMPSIADLDQDGTPEVIVEGGIVKIVSGQPVLTPFTAAGTAVTNIGYFVVSDLDGDGILDVITAGAAYHADGTRFVDTGTGNGFVAIGDLNKDGKPEVIRTEAHAISIWDYQAAADGGPGFVWLQQDLDMTVPQASAACAAIGGGPPTVADFNGDGFPDVALAGSVNYTIFDGKKLTSIDAGAGGTDGGNDQTFFLWTYYPTDDCSSAETGSTIFDFTGNGTPEALYSDQQKLRVFNGPDGGVLFQTCNTTGTLIEFPLVADVDNDGHADIVVVSNAYAIGDVDIACQQVDGGPNGESGLRVFSDPSLAWVRTRALWNEHAYHITNVNDDGTIPKKELPNWKQTGLNNFRQNKQPGSEFAAPDAVVSVVPSCGSPVTLTATVRNIGEAALPSGVEVAFYGAGVQLGTTTTPVTLYAAQSVTLTFKVTGTTTSSETFYAVVDPSNAPAHPGWHECRTDNNTSATVTSASFCGSGPK